MSTAIEVKTVSEAGITRRSTAAEMEHRRTVLLQIAQEVAPASVRHIYYRAVVAGLVPKQRHWVDPTGNTAASNVDRDGGAAHG